MRTLYLLRESILFPLLSILLDRNPKVQYHKNTFLVEALENTLVGISPYYPCAFQELRFWYRVSFRLYQLFSILQGWIIVDGFAESRIK